MGLCTMRVTGKCVVFVVDIGTCVDGLHTLVMHQQVCHTRISPLTLELVWPPHGDRLGPAGGCMDPMGHLVRCFRVPYLAIAQS
jgi:hypothetical protein